MNVSDVMQRGVKVCGVDSTLEAAAMLMWDNDCGALPVIDGQGHPVGIVTDRDIAVTAALNHRPLWELACGDITGSRPLFTCQSDEDVRSALKTMWAQRVRRLPVVDASQQLVGILSMDDVIFCAERGARGRTIPDLSFDDAMNALKAVVSRH